MTFIVKTFMFMQKIYFLLLIVFGGIFTASAQLVTTTPDFPLEGKEVTVVFDASLGSGGLIGYTGKYMRIQVLLRTIVRMNPIGNMLLPNGEIILKSIKCVHWEIINGNSS